MRKWLLIGLGLLVVLGAAYGLRRSAVNLAELSKPASIIDNKRGAGRASLPVEVARAKAARLSDDIFAIGTLLAYESVSVSSETSGRVSEILFKDGTAVAEGAPLFKLDADLVNASLDEANSRLSLAESTFNRNNTLRKSGTIAQTAYDASLTELEVARTAVESAKVLLKKLTIAAPFSGTLGFRTVSVGAYVTPGTVLVQLDAIDRLKVSFSVPELEQSRIATGQQVEVTADAVPDETFTATISAIAPSIDVNGRALLIRADLDNKALTLRPGLLVRISVKGPARDAVLVPEAAIVQRGDNAFVYLPRDNTAKQAKVRLGKRIPGSIEIVEGISAGDEVIIAGNTRLTDGAAIEVVPGPVSVN
jgi:membrane fusion protein (multidrug efflux system)